MNIKTITINLFIVFLLTMPVLASDVKTECKKHNINSCDLWVREEPASSEVYFCRAIARAYNNDTKGAMKDYDRAIGLNPNDFTYYYNRADLKLFLEDYEGVYNDLDKALMLDPSYNEDIKQKRNEAREKAGIADEFNSAKEYYKKGNRKLSGSDKDYKGAIEYYNKAIWINPTFALAYYSRGLAKEWSGDRKGAIEDFTQAIKHNPDDDYTRAYFCRGEIKKELGDYKGAIEDFTLAIKHNPDDTDAYFERGFVKSKLENYKGAIEDLYIAKELGSNSWKVNELIKEIEKIKKEQTEKK